MKKASKKVVAQTNGRIFISHATTDSVLVKPFVELLQTGFQELQPKIFCTSVEGFGIPRGKNFIKYIDDQMQNTNYVIMLITPAYYESPFCLCEMGATWALRHNIYPLIVPPLKYEDMKAVISGIQAGYINDQRTLDEMRDQIESLGIGRGTTGRWNSQRDVFIETFSGIIDQLPAPTVVTFQKHEETLEAYKSARQTIIEQTNIIRELNTKISRLESLKDREEVEIVRREFSTEQEKVDQIIAGIKETLDQLSRATCTALYYSLRNETWQPYSGFQQDESMWDDIKTSFERGFIENDGSGFTISNSRPTVRNAQEMINSLLRFVEECEANDDSTFLEDFDADNGCPFDLTNRDFWEDYLRETPYQG